MDLPLIHGRGDTEADLGDTPAWEAELPSHVHYEAGAS
jgi:hypothetical protein